jgi:hypothetical protein
MDHALPPAAARPSALWRDLVMPREHGSWSLALEPLLFGLIAAPSLAGGGLALAVVAAFFGRWGVPGATRRRTGGRLPADRWSG